MDAAEKLIDSDQHEAVKPRISRISRRWNGLRIAG